MFLTNGKEQSVERLSDWPLVRTYVCSMHIYATNIKIPPFIKQQQRLAVVEEEEGDCDHEVVVVVVVVVVVRVRYYCVGRPDSHRCRRRRGRWWFRCRTGRKA
jgi:hypothetical protein